MRIFILLISVLMFTSCNNTDKKTDINGRQSGVSTAKSVKEITLSPFERGRIIYKRCRACHSLDIKGKNTVGPNLWNIYGAVAGNKANFNYSKAMRNSDIIWDNETLNAYIQKPNEFMEGTRMSFIGIKKQEDRTALLIYLKAMTTPGIE
ncbi:MAG: c-type cytochrome [Hellea sp.]